MAKPPLQNLGASSGPSGFKERHEDTHKVMIGSENSVQSHTQTHRGWNQCSWHAHGLHLFFFGSLQAAGQGTQPFDVLQREAQRGQRKKKKSNPLQHVTSSLAERSPWGTPIGQTARLLLKQKSGQGCNT